MDMPRDDSAGTRPGAPVVVFPSDGATRSADVVDLLGRVPVFSTLEPADLEQIARCPCPATFEPGQAVFREGDSSDTCYVVREGHARAIRSHGDGRTITLATFGPGDIFGELAMFEDERRSATVEAIETTSVVGVLGPDMRRLMSEHPQISARLVIALGRRLRETNERLSRQSFQTVQSRVAVVLCELVEQEIAAGSDPAGRARHRHAGGSRAARRLLARVGQPLPGRARARRRHLPGTRPPHGPRPEGARAVCLLSARRPRRAKGPTRAGPSARRGAGARVLRRRRRRA